MSRSSNVFRSLVASSSKGVSSSLSLPRRSVDVARRKASSSTQMSGQTISVDPRVLEGVQDFIPRSNMDTICQWQLGLWNRLVSEVNNNPGLLEVKQRWDRAPLDITYVVSQTAKEASLTLAYNWAALLLNNSYFLETISPDEPIDVPAAYQGLEDKVAAYAEGIVGGGWIWLVRSGDNHAEVDIVPTFGSGTLLISNRAQKGRDGSLPVFGTPYSNVPSSSSSPSGSASPDGDPQVTGPVPSSPSDAPWKTTQRSFSRIAGPSSLANAAGSAAQAKFSGTAGSPMMRELTGVAAWPAPLAVLNLFEHAYVGEKYGVWDRGRYARDWWKRLDWNKVQRRSATMV